MFHIFSATLWGGWDDLVVSNHPKLERWVAQGRMPDGHEVKKPWGKWKRFPFRPRGFAISTHSLKNITTM